MQNGGGGGGVEEKKKKNGSTESRGYVIVRAGKVPVREFTKLVVVGVVHAHQRRASNDTRTASPRSGSNRRGSGGRGTCKASGPERRAGTRQRALLALLPLRKGGKQTQFPNEHARRAATNFERVERKATAKEPQTRQPRDLQRRDARRKGIHRRKTKTRKNARKNGTKMGMEHATQKNGTEKRHTRKRDASHRLYALLLEQRSFCVERADRSAAPSPPGARTPTQTPTPAAPNAPSPLPVSPRPVHSLLSARPSGSPLPMSSARAR